MFSLLQQPLSWLNGSNRMLTRDFLLLQCTSSKTSFPTLPNSTSNTSRSNLTSRTITRQRIGNSSSRRRTDANSMGTSFVTFPVARIPDVQFPIIPRVRVKAYYSPHYPALPRPPRSYPVPLLPSLSHPGLWETLGCT